MIKSITRYNFAYNCLWIFLKISLVYLSLRIIHICYRQRATMLQLLSFQLTFIAISSGSHGPQYISLLLPPSKSVQHCKISLTVIKQIISFYLILKSSKMLLAGGSFNAGLLVPLTWSLLIVAVKAKRLTRVGWD